MNPKPCPHCEKSETDRDPETGMPAIEPCNYITGAIVRCNWCGMSGPVAAQTREGSMVSDAIGLWNSLPRRTQDGIGLAL